MYKSTQGNKVEPHCRGLKALLTKKNVKKFTFNVI